MESTDRSRRVWAGVQVIGLIVLVAALLRQIQWAAVVASFRGTGPGEGVVVVLAVLAAMGLRLWKWRVQLRAMGLGHVAAATVARGFLLGVLLGAVTPLRIGEFYRIAAAAPVAGEARGRAAAGVLLDKGYELLVVVVTLAAGSVAVGLPTTIAAIWCGTFLQPGNCSKRWGLTCRYRRAANWSASRLPIYSRTMCADCSSCRRRCAALAEAAILLRATLPLGSMSTRTTAASRSVASSTACGR